MITITITDLTATENIILEAKSISNAWDMIRYIRNEFGEKANGFQAKIDMGDLEVSDRLPLEIHFVADKNGKIQFKDAKKIKARKEKAFARLEAAINNMKVEEELENDEDLVPEVPEDFRVEAI